MFQRPLQQLGVTALQARDHAGLRVHQLGRLHARGQHRDQAHRHQPRGHQRDRDGDRDLRHEDADVVGFAEQVGHEHDAVAQGAGAERDGHVAGADDRRLYRLVGHALAFLVDALHHHHRVVHQHAHRQQQAHHGQDVEGHADEVHETQGDHETDRDRQGHHQR